MPNTEKQRRDYRVRGPLSSLEPIPILSKRPVSLPASRKLRAFASIAESPSLVAAACGPELIQYPGDVLK